MQTKDPKPEIMRLEELALLVKAGDIKLPRFQRPFVWKEADMLKLLDSIYKGYPIGSILIWNSSAKLTSERSISGLEVNTSDNAFFPTNYLLDGQQRLTTLCGALFWNGIDTGSIWNIHFDLNEEVFVHPKELNLVNLFPLNKLINTSDFIRQCMKFEHHPKRDQYFSVAERLLKSIKDYKIAVVKIGDMTIEEVAPIFERINSTGRKLTIVDLMMAATWSDGFDLTTEIQKIRNGCHEIGFDDIGDPVILRSIAASAELGINKDDIQKLRTKNASELAIAAQTAKNSIIRALKFLQEEAGIKDYSYVPYGFQLTYISEYFRIIPTPTIENIKHLSQWFWYTSATRYFAASSNTGQVSKDLALIRSFALGKRARLFDEEEIDISRLLFDRFNLRNATSTTFAALLNYLSPTETLDGLALDGGHLKVKSNKFFGSFSPKNCNLDKLNISKIIYPYPQSPITIFEDIEEKPLDQHMLNNSCINFARREMVIEYINERALLISHRISLLTGCPTTYRIPSNSFEPEEYQDTSEDPEE